MPTDIDRNRVQQLTREGAGLIEVLSAREFEDEHLAGAINIPLAELGKQAPSRLERDRQIVVYCYDSQ